MVDLPIAWLQHPEILVTVNVNVLDKPNQIIEKYNPQNLTKPKYNFHKITNLNSRKRS